MALFWSKKPKAEKNYEAEARKGKSASPKGAQKVRTLKPASEVRDTRSEGAKLIASVASFGDVTEAVIRPHVTEKSGLLSQSGVYTFQISGQASKSTVSKAIKAMYKVTPVKVAIVNLPAKRVFVKGRWGTVSGTRKAMVTVKKGEKIDFV